MLKIFRTRLIANPTGQRQTGKKKAEGTTKATVNTFAVENLNSFF